MVVFKRAAMRDVPRLARRACCHNTANDGLRPPWRDLVPGKSQAQGVREINIGPRLKVRQITIRTEGSNKKSRICDRVCRADIDKGRKNAEVMVYAIVPVKCGVPRAQTFLGVARGRGAG